MTTALIYKSFISNLPNLLTTYRPRKPVAPNTVAAIPLEEERPPFPLGMMAWCSFLSWTVVKETADSPAGVQLPVEGGCLAHRQRSISIISGKTSILTKKQTNQNQLHTSTLAFNTTGALWHNKWGYSIL